MPEWEPVVGLEIHIHLKTRTKMFCRCSTSFGDPENTHTCPVCLAHPGALPVPNRTAIEWTTKLGLALGCEIAPRAVFARKNYFYPDNPKGYQISQYDEPLCVEGRFRVPGPDGEREIGIVRAHLEEDAAKTVHHGGATGRMVGADYSLVDFNRAGTPLVEIVTQPDIRSAEDAVRFLRLLRQTIVELGVSDAEMEKGTLRVDANVSIRERAETSFRTRWEIKNVNSFNFVGRGIEAAVREQTRLYESGGEVTQHTYDYEPGTDTLSPHRSKEEAEDYRYFPEPDLVPVEPPRELVDRLRAELPELPTARIGALAEHLGVAAAVELVTTGNDAKARALAEAGTDWSTAASVAMNQPDFDLANAPALAEIVRHRDTITRQAYSAAFAASATRIIDASEFLSDRAVSDAAELAPLVERILEANPGQVAAYRGGKEGLLGFFVGQVMKETQGKADPKAVNELLREKLEA